MSALTFVEKEWKPFKTLECVENNSCRYWCLDDDKNVVIVDTDNDGNILNVDLTGDCGCRLCRGYY